MVKHIVFFKLTQEGFEQKDEIIAKLQNLQNDIDFILALEVGVNFAAEPRAYDLALTVIVSSKEELNRYATHEKHLSVVEFLKSLGTTTKVVDYEVQKASSNEIGFNHAQITKEANVYFDGNVTSRSVVDSNGIKKTLGIMMPGTYKFGTEAAEHMEIISGEVEILLEQDSNWETIKGGEFFEVPANSSFDIKVKSITDYCCTYL
jgi:uncharacterized protein YaiE (UPF0345 family)